MSHLQVRNFLAATRKPLLEYFGLIMPGRDLGWIDTLVDAAVDIVGTIDGVNSVFTVECVNPLVFNRGLFQKEGVDYVFTLSSTTGGSIEFFVPPAPGSQLFAYGAGTSTNTIIENATFVQQSGWDGPFTVTGVIDGSNDAFQVGCTNPVVVLNGLIMSSPGDYTFAQDLPAGGTITFVSPPPLDSTILVFGQRLQL